MPKYQMLINYVPGEECRIAIVENGRLEELYQERTSAESHVGNIYKARVTNVEPSIQAAFVDFGLERNGFLHITDLHPKYFPGDANEQTERVGHKTPHRDRPPIQKCLKRGQEILVQILKEGIGTKGPTVTSYLSIPGRYLVVMPHMERLGVSRKVEDDDARREMRKILDSLDTPEGFGFIVRTAGIGKTKTDLKRDLAYLQRLWKTLDKRRKTIPNVGELYTESDLVIRTLRDVYTSDIQEVIIDNPQAARRASDFLGIISPRAGARVMAYKDPIPLFHRYDIERQIELINAHEVPLPSGGSLVIDQTEALVAIDVNSGKSRNAKDAEMNAYQTNVEATDEICRQLRLRDLGGVVVNDLIDMRDTKHRRTIEQRFRNNLKNDRARTRINSISQFGLLEMTRQRMRPSLKKSIYSDCPTCFGRGQTKSTESVLLHVMRRLALVLHNQQVARVELTISPDVAFQLLNRKRGELTKLESNSGKSVMVRVAPSGSVDFVELASFDSRNAPVKAESLKKLAKPILEQAKDISEFDDIDIDVEEDIEVEVEQGKQPVTKSKKQAKNKNDRPPTVEELMTPIKPGDNDTDDDKNYNNGDEQSNDESKSRRRRKRGGRDRGKSKQTDNPVSNNPETSTDNTQQPDDVQSSSSETSGNQDKNKPSKSRRRRGGRGRRRKSSEQNAQTHTGEQSSQDTHSQPVKQPEKVEQANQDKASSDNADAKSENKPSRRRRRGGRKHNKSKSSDNSQQSSEVSQTKPKSKPEPMPAEKPVVVKKTTKKKTSKKKVSKVTKASKATKIVSRKKTSRKKVSKKSDVSE